VLEQTQPVRQQLRQSADRYNCYPEAKIFDINNSAVAGDDCSLYDTTIRSQLQELTHRRLGKNDALVAAFLLGALCEPRLRVVAPMKWINHVNQYTGAGYFRYLKMARQLELS